MSSVPVDRPVSRFHRLFAVGLFLLSSALAVALPAVLRSRIAELPPRFLPNAHAAFILLFLLGAVYFVFRRIRARYFWEILFSLAVFLGGWYAVLLALPLGAAFLVSSGLFFLAVVGRRVLAHDLFCLLGCLGVAMDLAGWFAPEVLLVGLVALTVYDMVAGSMEGPVLELAVKIGKTGIVPGFIAPEGMPGILRTVESAMVSDGTELFGAGDFILPLAIIAQASMRDAWPGLVVLGCVVLAAVFVSRRDFAHPRMVFPVLSASAALPFLILRLLSHV